jgi:hypothetical protein
MQVKKPPSPRKVVDPKQIISDPDPTFKKVSAPTLDSVSDPATLVSASKKLRGNYTNVLVTSAFKGNFFGENFYLFLFIYHLVKKL